MPHLKLLENNPTVGVRIQRVKDDIAILRREGRDGVGEAWLDGGRRWRERVLCH